MARLPDQPGCPAYSEAVKELHGLASHELRRLAMRYADYFAVSRIKACCMKPVADSSFGRPSMTFSSRRSRRSP